MRHAGRPPRHGRGGPLKRSIAKKVRALGILQVALLAGVMLLLGVLFFAKLLTDQAAFEQGTRAVKRGEVEGLGKLLALELGRNEALRYARAGDKGDPAVRRAISDVRSSLWEKLTFIPELEGVDIVIQTAPGLVQCIRPAGQADTCDEVGSLERILQEWDRIDRLRKVGARTYAMPLYVAGAFLGVLRLQVSDSTAQYVIEELGHRAERDKVTYVVLFIVCLGAVSVLLFLALNSFFRRIHRPLIALTDRAVAFGTTAPVVGGDAPAPIDADPEDEIGVLVRRFAEMQARLGDTVQSLQSALEQKDRAILEREEKDALLRRSERLASVGVLAAGVAHEIGNKLNPMGFVVHNLKRRIEKGNAPDPNQVGLLERSIDDCTRILDKLRSMAKPSGDEREPVSVNAVVEDVILMLGAQTQSRGVQVDAQLEPTLPEVLGVRSELVQVLLNLVLNARDAILARDDGRGGRISVRTRTAGDHVILEVEDDGVGMTDEVKARVFEPFFTTKGLSTGGGSGGSGLGLYICYGILTRHNATIDIESTPSVGTRFVVAFAPA